MKAKLEAASGILRALASPALLSLFRRLKRNKPTVHQPPIWSGVYAHFREVSPVGEGFSSADAINETEKYTRLTLESHSAFLPTPVTVAGENHLLPLAAALVAKEGSKLTVLDFGGGMGVAFVYLRASLPERVDLDYLVIESERICERGTALFRDDSRIRFLPALPESMGEVDIAYSCVALQYVEDYKAAMTKLCSYRPKHVLLVKLSAGEIPTYVSAQLNHAGSIIPSWFFNLGEFVKMMNDLEYDLVFKGVLERVYDQSNFPEQYRLPHRCNLMFSRRGLSVT